jgi:prepilin-type N-terminal cleavage/methylation domain-containing protein/prepilin-type processing-associated H-X9-DG protein
MRKPSVHLGFSLIELLAVLAILGLLIGLLMPAVQSVRGAAAKASCQNNMKQITLGCQNYESRMGFFPSSNASYPIAGDPSRQVWLPWTVTLLPDLEFDNLYRSSLTAYYLTPPYNNPPHAGLTTVIKTYVCPSDARLYSPLKDDEGYTAAYCSYVGIMTYQVSPVAGTGSKKERGVMNIPSSRQGVRGTRVAEITDGLSNTIHFSESPPYGRWLRASWYVGELPLSEIYAARPCRANVLIDVSLKNVDVCRGPFLFGPGRLDNPCDSHHLWSLHQGGANFAMADGSVRYIGHNSRDLIPALSSISGGEVVGEPW